MGLEDSVSEPHHVLDSEGNYIRFMEGTKFRPDGTPIPPKKKSFGEMRKQMAKVEKVSMTKRLEELRAGREKVTRITATPDKVGTTLKSHRAAARTETSPKDRELECLFNLV